MSVEIKHSEVDGRRIAYTNESLFEVQIGKGKSAYKTKYSFKGDLTLAVRYYVCVNVGRVYKKRLVCQTLNKPVLARQFS